MPTRRTFLSETTRSIAGLGLAAAVPGSLLDAVDSGSRPPGVAAEPQQQANATQANG